MHIAPLVIASLISSGALAQEWIDHQSKPAPAQPPKGEPNTDFEDRLARAESQLNSDIKSCKPIDPEAYAKLSQEAHQIERRGEKASQSGAPVQLSRLGRDREKADDLYTRAVAKQKCPETPKPGEKSPPPKTEAQPPTTTETDVEQPPLPPQEIFKPGQPSYSQFEDKLAQAERQLELDIKACNRIDADWYAALYEETEENYRAALEAQKQGLPIDEAKLTKDIVKAHNLYLRASKSAAAQKCAPKKASEPQPAPQTKPPTPAKTTSMLGEPPQRLNALEQRLLDIHNAERAGVGAPPLQWDQTLSLHAIEYAQQLAQTGQLVHAAREGRGIERENLEKGLIGWSADRLLQEWVGEKRLFHAGIFPDVCSGDWMQCAHYTQMIWPTTTNLGCGVAQGLGFEWLVCRYSPGGNKDGKPVGYGAYRPERGK